MSKKFLVTAFSAILTVLISTSVYALLVQSGETYTVRGEIDVSSGTLTLRNNQIDRTKILEESLSSYPVELEQVYTWDGVNTKLPTTAATDDLGFVAGTWATDAATIQTSDAKATTVGQYGRFKLVLPVEYVADDDVQIRVRGGMITTVSDSTATVDLVCYALDGDGGIGSDLVTTGATSINSLTKANVDFVLTDSSLNPGDVIDCRVAIDITDGATGTAVIGEISQIIGLLDIRG